MASSMIALLILLPPTSVLLAVVVARSLGRILARNLSALARAQLACFPAGGGSSLFRRQLSAVVLRVALYRRTSRRKEEEEEEEEEEECVFCLCGIEEGEEIRELKCRHLFHRSCLDRWLARPVVATCPLCRCRLLTPPPEEEVDVEVEEEEDMMLFVASCVHGRSSWF